LQSNRWTKREAVAQCAARLQLDGAGWAIGNTEPGGVLVPYMGLIRGEIEIGLFEKAGHCSIWGALSISYGLCAMIGRKRAGAIWISRNAREKARSSVGPARMLPKWALAGTAPGFVAKA